MADLTYTQKATERRASSGLVSAKGDAHSLKALVVASVEVGASASDGTTIKFGRIPSNARLSGISRVYWDDLTTTASTLDIGLASVNANITSDPDALSNGHDVASAGTGANAIADPALYGREAWRNVNGQSTDPGGELDVYGSIVDAAVNAGGTVTLELYGYFD